MRRLRGISAFLVAVVVATAATRASVLMSVAGTPTTGVAGMFTYTFTATAATGEKLIGFDFAGGGGSYGVFGQLNQVNPFSLPTVFNDNNGLFSIVGADTSQDSQFRVKSTDGIAINAMESATTLRAAFSYLPANVATATNEWPFLQIATAGGASFQGTVTVRNAQGIDRLEAVAGGTPLYGGPAVFDAVIDNVVAESAGDINHQVYFQDGGLPTTLGNFRFDSFTPALGGTGSGPANTASFDATTFQFSWDPHGSALGSYKWLLTATNAIGSDDGSITVRITELPEPATISLLALILLAGGSCSRRFSGHC